MSRTGVARTLAAVALLLLAGAATTGWLSSISREDTWRILFLVGAVACAAIAFILAVTSSQQGQASQDQIYQPPPEWLFDLQEEITKSRLEGHAAAVVSFIELMTHPARCRSRIVETINLDGRSIQQRVSVEFVPSESRPGENLSVLYLPILLPRKGELVDNFKLTDAAGSTMTNLSYDETTNLVAVGLRTLLLTLTKIPYDQWSITRNVEFILLSIITKRGPTAAGLQESRIETAIRQIERSLSAEGADLLRSYVRALSAAYPIVAVVPSDLVVGNRLLVNYERTIRPAADSEGTRGSVRLGFKLKPRQVNVPLELALTAGSFHLRINGPSEKYLYEQHVRCRKCKKRLAKSWRGTTPDKDCYHTVAPDSTEDCHFHIQPRGGQNYLHLYMRGYGYSQTPIRNLETTAVFVETPPGTRATAAVTALATTVFVWTAGYLVSRQKMITNSDLPALLLALPAIVASWFGVTADGNSLFGSSLLARLSLAASGILSIGAIVTYLLQIPDINQRLLQLAQHPAGATHPVGHQLAFAGLTNSVWVILFTLSAANFLFVFWRFTKKLRYYAKLTNRADPITEGYRSQ